MVLMRILSAVVTAVLLVPGLCSAQDKAVGPKSLSDAKAMTLKASAQAAARVEKPSTDPVEAANLDYAGELTVVVGTPKAGAQFKAEYWSKAKSLFLAEDERLQKQLDELAKAPNWDQWYKIRDEQRLNGVFLRSAGDLAADAEADLAYLSLPEAEQKGEAGAKVLKRKKLFNMRLERAGPYLRDEIGPCGRPKRKP